MSKLLIIILKNLICSIESFDIQNIIIIFARNISGVIMCNIKYYIDETAAYFGNMLGEKVANHCPSTPAVWTLIDSENLSV